MSSSTPEPRMGIEGRWMELNDRLQEVAEERDLLRDRVLLAEDHIERLEGLLDRDLRGVAAERDDLKRQLAEAEAKPAASLLKFNESEQEAMDAVLKAYSIINRTWKLRGNGGELIAAVHVMLSFIQQRMLSRLSPDWDNWWEKEEANG